jgi:NADH:ubiquinone oxidoreductase subunit 2 (subunit N)
MKLKIYTKENNLLSIGSIFLFGISFIILGILIKLGYVPGNYMPAFFFGAVTLILSLLAFFRRSKDLLEKIIEVEKYEEVKE